MRNKTIRNTVFFGVFLVALFALFFVSIQIGTLKVTLPQLFRGLFVEYDKTVNSIVNLRFPRIMISMLAGASLAVSGVLLQAALKNPLADPGIIGVSSGAAFFSTIMTAFFPTLYFFGPMFAFLGGMISFFIIYVVTGRKSMSPVHLILTGVAMNALWEGFSTVFGTMQNGSLSGSAAAVQSNITMKTWSDVKFLAAYVFVGLVMSLCLASKCNLLLLEDKTARSIGVDIHRLRFVVSVTAVLLASISTAVVGTVSFLALIVPHIAKILVGSDNRRLVPFSIILGAFLFLLADTIGRTIAYPYEVAASVILAIIGGPLLIVLLKRSRNRYES